MPLEQYQKEALIANLTSVLSSDSGIESIARHIAYEELTMEELAQTGELQPHHRILIQQKVDVFTQEYAEEKVWKEAQKQNTIAGYNDYVKKYPHGKYTTIASTTIAGLKVIENESRKSQYLRELKKDINAYRSTQLIEAGISIADLQDAELNIPQEILEIYSRKSVLADIGIAPSTKSEIEEIEDKRTEVYFWGITSSGKTCTLASILHNARRTNEKQGTGTRYFQSLANIFMEGTGTLPQGNASGRFQTYSFDLLDNKKRQYPITLIDLPGEMIKHLGEIYNGEKRLREQPSIQNLLEIMKDKKNPKYHFFIVDITNNNRDHIDGLAQWNYLSNLANFFKQEEPDIFNSQTAGIAILFTKSDLLSRDRNEQEEKAKKILNGEYFENFNDTLKEIAFAKRIIRSMEDELKIIPFSIGDVYFKDKCVHNSEPAQEVIEYLIMNIESRKPKNFLAFLNR